MNNTLLGCDLFLMLATHLFFTIHYATFSCHKSAIKISYTCFFNDVLNINMCPMKLKKIKSIETPYNNVGEEDYQIEKRRLQVELLKIQQRLIKEGQRLVIVFEGRDAAGKGSTIKRFTENLIPNHMKVVALGVPTVKESKYWFRRYEKYFPEPGNIVFFDRSWYSRALIEPTMGYCTEKQYKYFMRKVLSWEHNLIDSGVLMAKFYLSIDKEIQLYRFEDRLSNPLTYWKFSENDLHARKKWSVFTRYKEQMFNHTSSEKSPWVVVGANKKTDARLTCMLYLVRAFGNKSFVPLTGEDVTKTHSVKVGGVQFRGLTLQQFAVLNDLKSQEELFVNIEA
jgi:polyphosphate kinase 2